MNLKEMKPGIDYLKSVIFHEYKYDKEMLCLFQLFHDVCMFKAFFYFLIPGGKLKRKDSEKRRRRPGES